MLRGGLDAWSRSVHNLHVERWPTCMPPRLVLQVPTDPCTTDNGGCSANATCTADAASLGGVACACLPGFGGDGATCCAMGTFADDSTTPPSCTGGAVSRCLAVLERGGGGLRCWDCWQEWVLNAGHWCASNAHVPTARRCPPDPHPLWPPPLLAPLCSLPPRVRSLQQRYDLRRLLTGQQLVGGPVPVWVAGTWADTGRGGACGGGGGTWAGGGRSHC